MFDDIWLFLDCQREKDTTRFGELVTGYTNDMVNKTGYESSGPMDFTNLSKSTQRHSDLFDVK